MNLFDNAEFINFMFIVLLVFLFAWALGSVAIIAMFGVTRFAKLVWRRMHRCKCCKRRPPPELG